MKHIYLILALLLFVGCNKNEFSEPDEKGNEEETRKITISIIPEEPEVVMTRSSRSSFDKIAILYAWNNWFTGVTLLDDINSSVEIDADWWKDSNKIYVYCYWESEIWPWTSFKYEDDLSDFFNDKGLFSGQKILPNGTKWDVYKDVMTGQIEIDPDNPPTVLKIPVKRVLSLHDFNIAFIPAVEGEKFELKSAKICSVPGNTNLFESKDYNDETNKNKNDYTPSSETEQNFFIEGDLDITKDETNTSKWTISTYLPENRMGGFKDEDSNWPWIAHYPDVEKQFYKQMYKRQLAINKSGFNPTYLLINGTYKRKLNNGELFDFNLNYYIYLGADNYKDFNVKRNKYYIYNITIRKFDEIDSRVEVVGKE